MTAKEFLNEHGILDEMTGWVEDDTHLEARLLELIEQYANHRAVQIAEKAVAEVLEEYDTVGHARPVIIAGRILNRIKTETPTRNDE